jgi:hypothetical protein
LILLMGRFCGIGIISCQSRVNAAQPKDRNREVGVTPPLTPFSGFCSPAETTLEKLKLKTGTVYQGFPLVACPPAALATDQSWEGVRQFQFALLPDGLEIKVSFFPGVDVDALSRKIEMNGTRNGWKRSRWRNSIQVIVMNCPEIR